MKLDIGVVRDTLADLAIDEDGEDVVIRPAYSGKGMFGSTCFSIRLPTRAYVYTFLAGLCVNLERRGADWQEVAWSATTGQMG